MGLISPGGENLLDFLELRQVLPSYVGNSGTHSGGLRKGQSPFELLGGLSGFLSRQCRVLRSCVESVPEPEVSSPVLTWILGCFWSHPTGVSPRPEVGACTCDFLPICSNRVTLPFTWIKGSVAFPRGFHRRLSHKSVPRATVV